MEPLAQGDAAREPRSALRLAVEDFRCRSGSRRASWRPGRTSWVEIAEDPPGGCLARPIDFGLHVRKSNSRQNSSPGPEQVLSGDAAALNLACPCRANGRLVAAIQPDTACILCSSLWHH